MASKFAEFIETKKIDTRRIVLVSQRIERLRPEDRALKLKKRKGAAPAEGAEKPGKPHSGRPVTQVLIDRVKAGKPVSGAAKTRLLRAVNTVLEQKKQAPAQLKELF
jgi:hypothetical protein